MNLCVLANKSLTYVFYFRKKLVDALRVGMAMHGAEWDDVERWSLCPCPTWFCFTPSLLCACMTEKTFSPYPRCLGPGEAPPQPVKLYYLNKYINISLFYSTQCGSLPQFCYVLYYEFFFLNF